MLGLVGRSPRTWLSCLLAGALCVALSGCHKASRTIYVIPRDTAEALWVTEHTGVAEAAAKAGVRIYWNGPNGENDVERQIVLAERAVHEHAMGLILSPNSPFALNTVIQRALEQKMPVVLLGARVPMPSASHLYFVANDVPMLGRLAADRVGTWGGEVGVVGVNPLLPGSMERFDSFVGALKEEGSHPVLVERLSEPMNYGQTELDTERMIREHPSLTSIVALNVISTRAAIGAVRAMHASGRVRIVGYDQTEDLLYLLRQGEIDALVVQDMRAMGNDAVQAILAARDGKPCAAITIVPPALVTRDNIDTERVQQMLLMNWRVGS